MSHHLYTGGCGAGAGCGSSVVKKLATNRLRLSVGSLINRCQQVRAAAGRCASSQTSGPYYLRHRRRLSAVSQLLASGHLFSLNLFQLGALVLEPHLHYTYTQACLLGKRFAHFPARLL